MAKTRTTRKQSRRAKLARNKTKTKVASGARKVTGRLDRTSTKPEKMEKVRFVYANMSEWFDYGDYFATLARKLGGDYVSPSGTLPMRGGGAYTSDCDLPKKIVKEFREEYKSYYSMLTQRQKNRMRPYIRIAILNARHILDSDPNLDSLTVILEGERLPKAGMSADDYQTFRRVLDHPDTQAWLNTLI
jgi:hypothetical protein